MSLIGLVGIHRHTTEIRHPCIRLHFLIVLLLAVMIFHPSTNTILAGLAQTFLNLAILAPLFWAPRYFRGDPTRLSRVLMLIFLFNGASAAVGILQVRDPGAWMPAEFSSTLMSSRLGIAGLQYRGAEGRMIVRPPGLGDSPGAAGAAGLLTATMGLAYLGLPVAKYIKALGIVGIMVGTIVIFLSHVRSVLLMLLGSAVAFVILLVMQKRIGTATILVVAMVGCSGVVIQSATTLGGHSTIDRFATLLAADPLTVYDRSARMGMVTDAFDIFLFEYPLGAGLARFGMMRVYFGDEGNLDSPMIWAEVQIPAWILEGGIPLLILYPISIVVAILRLLKFALRHPSPEIRQWACVVILLSASPVALIFSYCPFHSQMGMQFWFLIGAMEGIAAGPAYLNVRDEFQR